MEKSVEQTVIEINLSGSDIELVTNFRLNPQQFKLGVRVPFALEQVYKSTRELRYHLVKAEDDAFADKLFIVFSAMSPVNSFVYNYMRTMDEVKANKLFILDDFGDQGAYYIGHNRDFSIETSVMSLIQYIMAKLQIQHKNVTTIGSSKGGYAALYFGLKGHFGNVISGAPQSKIGDFTINQAPHRNVASYIAGNDDNGSRIYLNNLLYDLLNQPTDHAPKINLLCGDADHHYKNHVMPFYNAARSKGFNINFKMVEGVDHDDLKTFFPGYVIHHCKTILNLESDYEVDNALKFKTLSASKTTDNKLIVKCDAHGQDVRYAYYVYRDGVVEFKQHYINKKTFEFIPQTSGLYQVKVFLRDKNSETITKLTNKLQFEI